MEKLIEKLSTYNILNNILPGVVFCFLCSRLCGLSIVNDDKLPRKNPTMRLDLKRVTFLKENSGE